jgi:branched-chain amino acid transport system ATP-binding protein
MDQTVSAGFGLAGLFASPVAGDEPVMELTDLSASFGGVKALSGISLEVRAGDVLAVVGPNGAGKTTLLNCVCGLVRLNADATVHLSGEDIRGRSPAVLGRLGIARSFQDPQLVEESSVLENVMTGAFNGYQYSMLDQCVRRRRVAEREAAAREKAMGLLSAVGLAEARHRLVSQLPYGARKLVDIVRAMMSRPRLLLLDEPTSGLDMAEQKLVTSFLLELRKLPGSSLIIVEHHMDVVRAVATRVLGLQAGSILATGTPGEVLDSREFRAALVGAGDTGTTASGQTDDMSSAEGR